MDELRNEPVELRAQISRIASQTLARPRNADAPQDPLADRELDSVEIIQLLAALEDHFQITIPPEEIQPANFRSLDLLTRMIGRLVRP